MPQAEANSKALRRGAADIGVRHSAAVREQAMKNFTAATPDGSISTICTGRTQQKPPCAPVGDSLVIHQ